VEEAGAEVRLARAVEGLEVAVRNVSGEDAGGKAD
jgi:hypothetical protein